MDRIDKITERAIPRPSNSQPTSPQEKPDSAPQADCIICGGLGWLSRDLPIVHAEFGKLVPCSCRLDHISREKAEKLQRQAGIYPHEQKISLDDLLMRGDCTRQMLAEVRRFAAEPFGILTLWGGVGNGKSAALIALVNHFNAAQPGSAVYIRFADLLDIMREGFDPRPTAKNQMKYHDRYEMLKAVFALAIDEVDKANMTAWAFEFRTKFFDERYRMARSRLAHTMLAMNDDPRDLPDHISDRLRWGERVPDGFRIVFNGDPSARPAGL